jgi:hypothetical protein
MRPAGVLREQAEPIRFGVVYDFKNPPGFPQEKRDDYFLSLQMVFDEGMRQGLIDRPVEIKLKEVEGLPKGSVRAVIDAYGELVDEGCLAVLGPFITDNAVPTREAIEERFRVPAISVTGTRRLVGRVDVRPAGGLDDRRTDRLGIPLPRAAIARSAASSSSR